MFFDILTRCLILIFVINILYIIILSKLKFNPHLKKFFDLYQRFNISFNYFLYEICQLYDLLTSFNLYYFNYYKLILVFFNFSNEPLMTI